jgi:hypothetical protein
MTTRAGPLVPRIWIALSVPIALAAGAASLAGVLLPSTYARETASWSAQGVGQDLANLVVVLPAFLVSAYAASRRSTRGLLIWLGLLVYLVYSYVVYAFFTHFGPYFLLYVSALGLSFYALGGSVLSLDARALASGFRRGGAGARLMSALLMLTGILFTCLWLSEIVPALAQGTIPASITEVGLPVNPVHVLDLAFLLPAVILAGVVLRRGHPFGIVVAVPLTTFLIAMGLAIDAMVVVMRARGVDVALAMPAVVTAIVAIAAGVIVVYLRGFEEKRTLG